MKRVADRYFKKNESKITLPEDTIGKNQRPPWERKGSVEEIKLPKLPEEIEGDLDNLTATYWG